MDTRVLLVQDNIESRLYAAAALALAGVQVRTALGGAEGWQVLQAESEEAFSAVIVDVDLHTGDAVAFIRRLRTLPADLPVLLLSRDSTDVIRQELGVKDALPKPIDPTMLCDWVLQLAGGVQ
jgi:two-component system response regulator QseB